jgi:acylphosphatase
MKTAHLKISGKVQGVFFRARAGEVAKKLAVSGWIRNNKDGQVEACISGDEKAIEEFILWCKKGPERAEVENVSVKYVDLQKFENFKIVR